jgi:hypothetical protein
MTKSTAIALILTTLICFPIAFSAVGFIVDTITEMVTPVQEDLSQ